MVDCALKSLDWTHFLFTFCGQYACLCRNVCRSWSTVFFSHRCHGRCDNFRTYMSTIYPCQIALNSLFGDVSIFPILFANCIVLTVRDGDTVKHYRIRQLDEGGFFISRRTTFRTLQELVEHYSADADGLCVNLRKPCIQVSIFSNARPQLNIIICLLLGTAFPLMS